MENNLKQILIQTKETNVILTKLFDVFLACSTLVNTRNTDVPPEIPAQKAYPEEELRTVKEAQTVLKVSRWKIDQLRNTGKLTTIKLEGGAVRLIPAELQALRYSYAVPKGKV